MHKPSRPRSPVPCGGAVWRRPVPGPAAAVRAQGTCTPVLRGGGGVTVAEATGFLLVFRWFVGNRPFPMARHCHKNRPSKGNLSSHCREAGPGPILPPAGDRPGPHPRVPPRDPSLPSPSQLSTQTQKELSWRRSPPGSGALPGHHPRVTRPEPGKGRRLPPRALPSSRLQLRPQSGQVRQQDPMHS